MKKILLTTIAAASFATGSLHAQVIASDSASNYTSWTNGANAGTGFGAWAISSANGTGGFGGNFIGDPSAASITGMPSSSFALYANPTNSGAFATAGRTFTALNNGDTLSFLWGINFDSGAGGNKGFSLYSGGIDVGEIVNVNNAGSSAITLNGNDVGFGYGTAAMTWQFTYNSGVLSITANDRDGTGTYATNLTVAAPNAFKFYASSMQAGNQAQPYFNSMTVTAVPEPSTYALLVLSAAGLAGYTARRRARK